jgi:hypothetical protein
MSVLIILHCCGDVRTQVRLDVVEGHLKVVDEEVKSG